MAKICTILLNCIMEIEIIKFHNNEPPIRISHLAMRRDVSYRGLHSHPAVEIVTVKSGSLSCYVNGDRINAGANQTVLINSNIGHILTSQDAEIVYMQIDISGYKDNACQGEFAPLYAFISSSRAKPYQLFSDDRELDEILQRIQNKYYEDREESRWYLKAYIYELVAFLFAHSFVMLSPGVQVKKIASVVRYIDEHFRHPITLDDICAGAGYNKYTVCHTFREVTGQTVFAYINFLRIQAAAKKLAEKNRTITEIAAECGFSSAAYFNRVFKTVMGSAPSQYRKHI